MKYIYLFVASILIYSNGISQNIRFSYQVTNPTPSQSLLTVYVQKIGVGTENLSSFNYGFYYKSSEATVQGYAAGATDASMTPAELSGCVSFTYANNLGWATDGTGAISAVVPAQQPFPGYDRLFAGQLFDGMVSPTCDPAGTDISSTPIPIVSLLLNNFPGGAPSQDSAVMADSQNFGAWEYADNCFNANSIQTVGSEMQALPIVLVSFSAVKYNERNSLLTWTTSSEINSNYFNIQRSFDQKFWTNVGRVSAFGNSQIIQNYEFVDENVYNGKSPQLTVYYRLDMVDMDSRSKLSPIKNVLFGNTSYGRDVAVYPNPSSEGVQIEWEANRVDQPTSIEFFNAKGELVYTSKVPENTNQQYIDYDQTSILPGLYILRILSGTEAIEHKQIVVTQR